MIAPLILAVVSQKLFVYFAQNLIFKDLGRVDVAKWIKRINMKSVLFN